MLVHFQEDRLLTLKTTCSHGCQADLVGERGLEGSPFLKLFQNSASSPVPSPTPTIFSIFVASEFRTALVVCHRDPLCLLIIMKHELLNLGFLLKSSFTKR